MRALKSKLWWEAAGTRAIKTMAQTMIGSISTAAILQDVNWKYLVSATLLAGFVSLVMNLQGLPEVDFSEEEN